VLLAWPRVLNRLRAVVRSAVTTFVVLTVTLWLMPGVASADVFDTLGLVLLVAGVGAVLRPLLLAGVTALGGWGAMLLGVMAQVIVITVALELDPANRISNLPTLVVAAILAVVFAAIVDWMADIGTDDTFVKEAKRLMRAVRRRQARRSGGPVLTLRRPRMGTEPGVLIVQLDGVAEPVLRWAVRAGNLPTLGRWLRSGSHSMRAWHTGLPSATPASQAGILHGAAAYIPAFRWYEKDSGRIIVTNRARDAAELEARFATGRGLLADGGASISNVFSGDAPTSVLTFSRAGLPHRRTRGWTRFFGSPQVVARGLVLVLAEMVKELHQGRRQRRRRITPRVKRGGVYVVLRAVTNVLLRDLNVALIAEQLAKATPVVYVDFIDYDEVAHHAGPTRPEALQTLEGLDRVLGALSAIVDALPHDYEIVVLSDHGQSQGATFQQRYGQTLTEVVDTLVDAGIEPVAATSQAEDWGPVNAFLTELSLRRSVTGSVTRRALRSGPGGVELGPAECEPPARSAASEVVVTSSGNLAMIYLADVPGRIALEELDALHPRLVHGLATHPGIGFVVVDSAAQGPVAIGAGGVHVLGTGRVDGTDPLAGYGELAAEALLRHSAIPHVGDVVVVSRVDEQTQEVAAFEELVGCHGGLGGWQTEAVLVHPARWRVEGPLFGADAVHDVLVSWLEDLGRRRSVVLDQAVLDRDGVQERAG